MMTVGWAALVVLGCSSSDPAPVEIGDTAPPFSLPSADQATGLVTSDQFHGKITVINFWSTTCEVCLKEIDDLARVHRSGKAVVIGIALETDADYVRRFVKQRGISYTVALGNEDIFARYDGAGVPYTLVLDRSGAIRLRLYGRIEGDELEKFIDKIDRGRVAFGPPPSTQAIQ
jgi:peroxiredoxin